MEGEREREGQVRDNEEGQRAAHTSKKGRQRPCAGIVTVPALAIPVCSKFKLYLKESLASFASGKEI